MVHRDAAVTRQQDTPEQAPEGLASRAALVLANPRHVMDRPHAGSVTSFWPPVLLVPWPRNWLHGKHTVVYCKAPRPPQGVCRHCSINARNPSHCFSAASSTTCCPCSAQASSRVPPARRSLRPDHQTPAARPVTTVGLSKLSGRWRVADASDSYTHHGPAVS